MHNPTAQTSITSSGELVLKIKTDMDTSSPYHCEYKQAEKQGKRGRKKKRTYPTEFPDLKRAKIEIPQIKLSGSYKTNTAETEMILAQKSIKEKHRESNKVSTETQTEQQSNMHYMKPMSPDLHALISQTLELQRKQLEAISRENKESKYDSRKTKEMESSINNLKNDQLKLQDNIIRQIANVKNDLRTMENQWTRAKHTMEDYTNWIQPQNIEKHLMPGIQKIIEQEIRRLTQIETARITTLLRNHENKIRVQNSELMKYLKENTMDTTQTLHLIRAMTQPLVTQNDTNHIDRAMVLLRCTLPPATFMRVKTAMTSVNEKYRQVSPPQQPPQTFQQTFEIAQTPALAASIQENMLQHAQVNIQRQVQQQYTAMPPRLQIPSSNTAFFSPF